MTELKKHQQPMCIEDQVENLKSLGLIIRDEKYATIGYEHVRKKCMGMFTGLALKPAYC